MYSTWRLRTTVRTRADGRKYKGEKRQANCKYKALPGKVFDETQGYNRAVERSSHMDFMTPRLPVRGLTAQSCKLVDNVDGGRPCA